MNSANIYEYLKNSQGLPNILVTQNNQDSINVGAVCKILGLDFVIFPDVRLFFRDDARSFYEEIREYLLRVYDYYQKDKPLIISPIHTLKLPLPKRTLLQRFKIEFADTLDLEEFREKLYLWGYESVDIITQKGEVSIRGDIIDIFPPNSQKPFRIELFDSDVEAIYPFDIRNQRRDKRVELESIEIAPALFSLNEDEYRELNSRVESGGFRGFKLDLNSFGIWVLEEFGEFLAESRELLFLDDFSQELKDKFSFGESLKYLTPHQQQKIPEAKEYRELHTNDINKIIETHKDRKIVVLAKDKSLVRGSSLKNIDLVEFCYSDGVVNLIGKDEIILSINKRERERRVKSSSIILDEITPRDYVVHQHHGVGIFRGIVSRSVLGVTRDFVEIEYQQESILYIPVESLDTIDRYIADSGSLPRVDKLGKGSFKNLKAKLKDRLFAIASEIINISAQRALKDGLSLKVDSSEFEKFLARAGFEHTRDQLRAIEDIREELQSGKIMDRILSADVGFGKTEVAMSAIFLAVKSGYQAMMVVPTTLLSNQHYKTLQDRFQEWGVKVARVDRYTTPKEKKEIFKSLEDGTVDVVVGTHALLKAKFKNLALVIIDEEHKFGVKQKEALKQVSINTHLLMMSATPIPRSLNMALSQIKSFSEILTPPKKRAEVRTFLSSFEPQAIKEAIVRELRRGGQVFYIYNSIATIEEKAKEIKSMLKDLKILILHSKISPAKMEEEMMRFEAKEYDLLLSTTIVESGLHLPNVNSIIIDGADRFGVADLHQLRGRVGRGGKEGFCYLVVKDVDTLQEKAQKRLLALETHSELGSGAILAMRDLELRGGGNILGEAQSGHIKQVGYALYLKMLEKTIRELTGQKEIANQEIDMNIQIDAYLSRDLIFEDRLRIELYRRLAQSNSLDSVYEIKEEIEDRFGELDNVSLQYIDLIAIKVLALQKGVSKLSSFKEKIFVEYHDKKERVSLKAKSKDADDIIDTLMDYLKK